VSGEEIESLLMPDESILWVATPISHLKLIFNILVLVLSFAMLAFSAWLLYSILVLDQPKADNGGNPKNAVSLLMPILFYAAFALFGLWVVVTDRGVVKKTVYALTSKRAFSAVSRRDKRVVEARFIDVGRMLYVERGSRLVMVAIPVLSEPGEKAGFMSFDGLSLVEGDRASACLSQILGKASDAK
jgi:hypothetical protein